MEFQKPASAAITGQNYKTSKFGYKLYFSQIFHTVPVVDAFTFNASEGLYKITLQMWRQRVFWMRWLCVMCATLCVTVDEQRVTDALEASLAPKVVPVECATAACLSGTEGHLIIQPGARFPSADRHSIQNWALLVVTESDISSGKRGRNDLIKRIRVCFCHLEGSLTVS